MDIILKLTANRRSEFFEVLARAAWGEQRPAPTNLDGLADLLKETRPLRVKVLGDWNIDIDTTGRIEEVFYDLGVRLDLPC